MATANETAEHPYRIYNPTGQLVLQAPESCLYPKLLELALAEAGYTIYLHDKKLTKTTLRRSVSELST